MLERQIKWAIENSFRKQHIKRTATEITAVATAIIYRIRKFEINVPRQDQNELKMCIKDAVVEKGYVYSARATETTDDLMLFIEENYPEICGKQTFKSINNKFLSKQYKQ